MQVCRHNSFAHPLTSLPYYILILLFVAFATQTKLAVAEPGSADVAFQSPTAEKRVVQITANGLVPSSIELTKSDSSVFFVNASKLGRGVAIEFGPRRKHCWTKNMEVLENGTIQTKSPVPPQDFALVCFPEPGRYAVRVLGEGVHNQVGEVIVR